MSKFLTTLKIEEIEDYAHDGGGAFRLLAELIYFSDVAGRVIRVPTGFETDFASVPRVPIVYDLLGNLARMAATVHDYLYTTCDTDRLMADDVFYEAAVASGVPAWKAKLMWMGIRIGGGKHWGKSTGTVAKLMG